MSSAGALLSGELATDVSAFNIDYSIQPSSIRVVPAIDVLNGDFPVDAFNGRSVIVGASAIELSDQLVVPVHGVVAGPLIHALATETLMRDLAPRMMRSEVVAVVLLALLTFLHSGSTTKPMAGSWSDRRRRSCH